MRTFPPSLSLAVVGWGRDYRNEGFGPQSGVKFQLVNLVTSVQTLLRGKAADAEPRTAGSLGRL